MTWIAHSTDRIPPPDRAAAWSAVIADVYFPLALTYRSASRFKGKLSNRSVGRIEVSRLRTEPLQYERLPRHISSTSEEEFLVTLPRRSPVTFYQMNREVRCEPGGFILERGDAPYRFSYEEANDLLVLKVPKPLLGTYLREPDQHCARVFDGRSGMGGLFSAMARRLHDEDTITDAASAAVVSRHLIELLTLALEDRGSGESMAGSAVRTAHLRRAGDYIAAHLTDPSLSPETIANACGVSKRYLHDLFRDVNGTVSQHIRDQRLIAARAMLEVASNRSIAEIAYRFGFCDQAQFSRLFKARFGETPSEHRARQA
ncbi:helix-turn-helix domain-containing protein [Pseudohoeflea coraliihabitans]|uniref:Helix-turn-helix domain-containing protein n=1 Tax=Pseudohoeflea coraliihabitans TaxID=2860393 RepID=A0ABS6WST8_9HYPH|nr:helix-turn-helix domain-containing protein [Pseudohoeflea sp. DP4N28-3]MBW3099011.1 helix-turn-helix domain-containing protein [Pseudohoeflea sp. DP4N28-3]